MDKFRGVQWQSNSRLEMSLGAEHGLSGEVRAQKGPALYVRAQRAFARKVRADWHVRWPSKIWTLRAWPVGCSRPFPPRSQDSLPQGGKDGGHNDGALCMFNIILTQTCRHGCQISMCSCLDLDERHSLTSRPMLNYFDHEGSLTSWTSRASNVEKWEACVHRVF